MKFMMKRLNHNSEYYFIFINGQTERDSDICKILNIPLKEYQDCLLKFNGFKNWHDIFFNDKLNCQKALDYLNKNYGVLLALLGDEI